MPGYSRLLKNALCALVASATFPSISYAQTEITFEEPYSDEGGLTAQALAEYENISVAEASQRLISQADNARAAYIAQNDHQDEVAATDFTYVGSGGSRVRLYVKRGVGAARRAEIVGKIKARVSKADIEVIEVPFSMKELNQSADKVLAQMDAAGIKGAITPDVKSGTLKLIVPDPDAAQAAVRSGRLKLPQGAVIERGPEIVPTGISWGGGAYLAVSGKLCTSGFTAVYTVGSYVLKGFVTAEHCGRSGYIDAYPTAGSPSAYSARVYTPTDAFSFRQDFQFMRFQDQSNNQIRSSFFDGVTNGGVRVRGGIYPGTYTFLCKFGRITKRTCGYVAFSTYRTTSGTYFKLFSFRSSPSNPLAAQGDSGGPVFSGNMIAGIVTGVDSAGDMYFSPAVFFRGLLPNMRLFL